MYFDLRTKLIPTGYYAIPTAIQWPHMFPVPLWMRLPLTLNFVLSRKFIASTKGSPSVLVSLPDMLNTVRNAIGKLTSLL